MQSSMHFNSKQDMVSPGFYLVHNVYARPGFCVKFCG